MAYEAQFIVAASSCRAGETLVTPIQASSDEEALQQFARAKTQYPSEGFGSGAMRAKLLRKESGQPPVIIGL